ncbi:MAG: prolipoprotein diacylglyceryl transferase [Alphaproteobacteria bacterium]|nr:prolipoprotein diacylglyceryl transferase [Alphaproteobacteria bacterium]
MFQFPNIDPVAFYIMNWPVYWYGISYVLAFITGLLLIKRYNTLFQGPAHPKIESEHFDNMLTYGILGIILGGRMGHMFFYDFHTLLHAPLTIFKVWQGGMAFHGGLIGCIISVSLYTIRHRLDFLAVADRACVVVPIGLFYVRIANFINAELYGRVTDSAFGIIFPGHLHPRHPSQLYEAFLEGVVLFMILRFCFGLVIKRGLRGFIFGLFLLGYGCARFITEYMREPTDGEFYILGILLSYGQVLTLPMILVGLWFMASSYLKTKK